MINCSLQEVFHASGIQALLPESPGTYFGRITHRFLELAGKGHVREEQLEEVWTSILQEQEMLLQEHRFTRHLIPLKNNIRQYEVKKRLVFKAAIPMIKRVTDITSFVQNRAEYRLASEDGIIIGIVDRLVHTANGCEIIDYKTGAVIDKITNEVKQSYQLQMKLYAASYYSKFGEWPVALRIQSLNGENYRIIYSADECLELLKQAEYHLDRINRTITSNRDGAEVQEQLGNPSPSNCRYCSYRHQCKPYWNRRETSPGTDWPRDIQGVFLSENRLRNNKDLLKLLWKGTVIKIRGLEPLKHDIQDGSFIQAYGLVRDEAAHAYSEGLMTTIFSSPL